MITDRAKRYMRVCVLLLMTGCIWGVNLEPEANLREERQVEDGLRVEVNKPAVREYSEDDDFYVQCLQNLHQGNNITYADGYYYFRSQTENYSLCRTKGTGMPVEVVADQIPGSVYVRGD